MGSSGKIDELVVAAQSGDKEAENQLFLQLHARIFNLVQRRIWNKQTHKTKIKQDAEDLTEDICLKIAERYKTISFEIGFMPWVFRVVRNKIGEYYRNRNRRRGMESLENINLQSEDIDALAEHRETDRIISAALKNLRGRCREIITALLQDTIKEYIQEQQKNTATGTIYSRIHRCRSHFKDLLQQQGFEL